MNFPYLPTPLLLEGDKCLTNQLWPFSYMSKTSGHSAGKLLKKDIIYMPLDIRNSGWYLLAASTLCHCVQWLWCVWDMCDLQWANCMVYLHYAVACITHCALWTGQPHCVHTIQPPLTSHTAAFQTHIGFTLHHTGQTTHSSMWEIPESYSNHCFSDCKGCLLCFLCLLL